MNELPKGWASVRLEEAASDISYGFTAKATNVPIGPKFLRITDIQGGRVDWSSVPYCLYPGKVDRRYSLQSGDIVFARTGATTGKSFLIKVSPSDAVFASYLIRVRPRSELLAPYIAHFFNSAEYWEQITESLSGSAQPSCNASKLSEIIIPMAPLPEQRRIVAQLDGLMERVSVCQRRLQMVPDLLARFRQSVLAAACSGRLTASWRRVNFGIEDAAALACHINERRTTASVVETLPANLFPEDELPATWAWVRFGSIIGELRNGVSLRPNIDPPGIPILRISAARPGRVDIAGVRYMPHGHDFLPDYAIRDDDLLFTRYNGSVELLGVCGMVRGVGKKTVLYPDKLMRVRFDHKYVLPAYAEIFFQAAKVHERIVANAKSSAGQNGISGSDVKGQAFALPPLPEQHEIVRRVEGLFALAERIEARFNTSCNVFEKIASSIVAKAFRGELVTTEAELAEAERRGFESAEELLARVRNSYGTSAGQEKSSKRRNEKLPAGA